MTNTLQEKISSERVCTTSHLIISDYPERNLFVDYFLSPILSPFFLAHFAYCLFAQIEKPLQRHGGRLEHNETYCGSCYGAEVVSKYLSICYPIIYAWDWIFCWKYIYLSRTMIFFPPACTSKL